MGASARSDLPLLDRLASIRDRLAHLTERLIALDDDLERIAREHRALRHQRHVLAAELAALTGKGSAQ